jgi:hypothetical protein
MGKNSDSRCKGLTKNGQPCRAAATEGGLCLFHANPDKASELGRIGGRRNRHAAIDNVDLVPVLDSVMAVRDLVARLIADVYAGRVHPRIGAGLAPLLHLQLRAIETTEIDRLTRRLALLERQIAYLKAEQRSAQEFRGSKGLQQGQSHPANA